MVDIFSQGQRISTSWAKLNEVGDAVQGTYIGRREAQDTYGNKQIIYELMQDGGSIVNVGVREAKVKFHQQMAAVQLGQIVGIKLTEKIPNTKGNPTNVLSVFADANIKNEEWLKSRQERLDMMNGDGMSDEQREALEAPIQNTQPPVQGQQAPPPSPVAQVAQASQPDVPFASQPTDADKTKNIFELAQAKLGVTDPMAIKDAVMEKTGLAFIPSNFDKIIDLLRQL